MISMKMVVGMMMLLIVVVIGMIVVCWLCRLLIMNLCLSLRLMRKKKIVSRLLVV